MAHAHNHGHGDEGGHTHSVRVLTSEDCRRVDRVATEQYGIPSIVLMENAGRSVAEHVTTLLEVENERPSVLVLAGHGNNGGDGLVAARHLLGLGLRVGVILATPEDRVEGDAGVNLAICKKIGIPMKVFNPEKRLAALRALPASFAKPMVVIDALLGTGQKGDLREPYAALVDMCNEMGDEGSGVLAVDVPTGLDADSGAVGERCVRAHVTVCMVAPKPGVFSEDGIAVCGQLVEGEIGVPAELVERFGELIEYECGHDHGGDEENGERD